MSGHAKTPPASHQVSVTSLKLLIQQIHPPCACRTRLRDVCSTRPLRTVGPEPLHPHVYGHAPSHKHLLERKIIYAIKNRSLAYCVDVVVQRGVASRTRAMRDIAKSILPHACLRQSHQRPTPSFFAARAGGVTTLEACISAAAKVRPTT